MNELKPCPFCGGDRIYYGYFYEPSAYWDSRCRGERGFFIKCGDCDIVLKKDYEKEAIEAWNRRTKS